MSGIKNVGLSLLSGLLLGYSWPTYGFSFLIFFAFIPLLIAEDNIKRNHKKYSSFSVLSLSFLTFSTWNIITVWWTWNSTPIGMILIVFFHALFQSIQILLYHKLRKRLSHKIRILFLACMWMSFEKLDMFWELSLPWLHLGNAFSEQITWIQWYEYTGIFGGSVWVWTTNSILFLGIVKYRRYNIFSYVKQAIQQTSLVIAIPIIVSLFIFGCYKENHNPIYVKILQPNIDPYTEKYELNSTETKNIIMDISKSTGLDSIDFIISPETTFSYPFDLPYIKSNRILKSIKNEISNGKSNFLTGMIFKNLIFSDSLANEYSVKLDSNSWINIYNSAVMISQSDTLQVYHKSKALVGVESVPYKSMIQPIFGDLLFNFGGTVTSITPQKQRKVFYGTNPTHRVAPIICYESVYGNFIRGYINNGANFLAIITNDGWWGDTEGHRQHLSYARLRAIETRRSIARSANTGISAIINQKGQIINQLPYCEKGSLSGKINANNRKTFYVKYGDYIPRVAFFIFSTLLLWSIREE